VISIKFRTRLISVREMVTRTQRVLEEPPSRLRVVLGCMVADCRAFVDLGRFYLQSNTARIVPSALTINGMSFFQGRLAGGLLNCPIVRKLNSSR